MILKIKSHDLTSIFVYHDVVRNKGEQTGSEILLIFFFNIIE